MRTYNTFHEWAQKVFQFNSFFSFSSNSVITTLVISNGNIWNIWKFGNKSIHDTFCVYIPIGKDEVHVFFVGVPMFLWWLVPCKSYYYDLVHSFDTFIPLSFLFLVNHFSVFFSQKFHFVCATRQNCSFNVRINLGFCFCPVPFISLEYVT